MKKARMRFSIAGLLALVMAIAVGLAALRHASPIWAGLVTIAVALVLLTSVLGAVLGRDRVSWLGFSVFGTGCALLSGGFLVYDAIEKVKPSDSISLATRGIDALYPHVRHEPPTFSSIEVSYTNPEGHVFGFGLVDTSKLHKQTVRSVKINKETQEYRAFLITGHALLCLLVGCLGVVIAQGLAWRNRQRLEGLEGRSAHRDRDEGNARSSRSGFLVESNLDG